MSVVLPLVCWPWPLSRDQVDAVRAAKEALCTRDKLDFKVQLLEAHPGSPSRVLSFSGPPPFALDIAKLRDWRDPAELQHWIEWCLDLEMDVEEGFTVLEWLQWQMPGTKEVTNIYTQFEYEEAVERARELAPQRNGQPVAFR